MKSISGKEFVRLLEIEGWRLLRTNGSHHIYGKSGRIERLSVPIHGNRPLKLGLFKHLVKVAALPENVLPK